MPVDAQPDPTVWQQIIGVLLAIIGILGGIIVKLKSSMRGGTGKISDDHLERKIDERIERAFLKRDVEQWRHESHE